ncbi:Transposable element Tc3 transposase [Anthophora quadrimaculata]
MERYTIQQRVEIVKIYYKNSCSVRQTFRELRNIYGRNDRPTERSIQRIIAKFEQSGSVADRAVPLRRRNARSKENIDAVAESVSEDPNLSIPRCAQAVGLSATSTWRILRKDLGMHPYKIQLTQELKPQDHQARRTFTDWALQQLQTDPNFGEKVIFSDEAHFWLNGFVNKQNCRISGESNPQQYQESPLHPEKITVWCGFWSGGVIEPYIFRNENGQVVTVNGERYRAMITDFLWPQLDDLDLDDMWFQQDGATCHTSGVTLELLQEKFPGRVISRRSDVEWPPRSCDLTPLDFFLWGYVKSLVYSNKPITIDQLENNIVKTIGEIQPELCNRVMQNWTSRIESCKRSRGGHLNDIIFKT